jgi:hypothetical protein
MTRDKSGKLKDTGVRFSDIAGACEWLCAKAASCQPLLGQCSCGCDVAVLRSPHMGALFALRVQYDVQLRCLPRACSCQLHGNGGQS